MTAQRIQEVREQLDAVREYHQRYNAGRDFTFDETIGRLVTAISRLADELDDLEGGVLGDSA